MGDFHARLIFGWVANVRLHGTSSAIVLAVPFVSKKNRERFSWKLDSAITKKGMCVKNILSLQNDFRCHTSVFVVGAIL